MSNNKINSDSKTNKNSSNIKTNQNEINKQKNNATKKEAKIDIKSKKINEKNAQLTNDEFKADSKQKVTSSKSNKTRTTTNKSGSKSKEANTQTIAKTNVYKANKQKNATTKKRFETKEPQIKKEVKTKIKQESDTKRKTIDESKTTKIKTNTKTKTVETKIEVNPKTTKSKIDNSSKGVVKKLDEKQKVTNIESENEKLKNKTLKEKTNEKNNKESSIKHPISNSKNNILKKVFNISSLIIKTLFIISFIINLVFLLKIDILPIKYLSIFVSFSLLVILFAILTEFILKNKILKIISILLSIIAMLLYIFIYIYINRTDKFINGLFNDEQLETYYLAVLSDSDYENINDLRNLKIGTYYNNEETYNQIIKIVNKSIEYEEKKYDNLIELCNGLINGEIDAILINDASKDIIEENNELINIQLKYIYDVAARTKINIIPKDLNVVNTPFIIYITGIDTYGEISNTARSDVNIVATVNPKTKEILLVTIPRDYYVQLHDTTGNRDKLTHAGIYGIDMSASTIEDLLDIDINYYIRLNFSTLINAVDAIGGIDVYSAYDFNTYGYQFHEGYNFVNGEYALAFSRARYNFANGDRTRGENQMRVIEAIINKLSSSRVLVTNYLDILNSLNGTFQTNIDSNRIYDLVKMQLSTMPSWKVETYSLNGFDSSNYTYSMGDMLLYVMEPDYNTINVAKSKIKELLNKK